MEESCNGGHSFIVCETRGQVRRLVSRWTLREDLTSWRGKVTIASWQLRSSWVRGLDSCPGLQQEKASLSLNHGLVHLGTFHTRVALSASGQILAGLLGLGTVFNFCQISHRVELHFF